MQIVYWRNALSAGDSLQDKGVCSDWKFAPLQWGLGVKNWRNLIDNQTDTVFSFVLCSMSQKSAILSLSAVGGVFKNYGISIAGINGSKENYGINIADTVQIGLTNDMGTVQIGLLNGRGCVQIGLWNYCPGSYIPYFPLIKFDMGKKE